MERQVEQAREYEEECNRRADAYSAWLTKLTPANWVLVLGATLLSMAAGRSIFANENIFSYEVAGILAFISAGLTLVHSTFNCDAHQAECRKAKRTYKSLAWEYKNLKWADDEEACRTRLQSLNEALGRTIRDTEAEPWNLRLKWPGRDSATTLKDR